MALKDEILQYLKTHPGATDTELERALGKNHQHINITCRGLVGKGVLIRRANPDKDNRIGNFISGTVVTKSAVKRGRHLMNMLFRKKISNMFCMIT